MNNSIISDQELDKHISQLSTEMTPNRDLWVGIERAMTQQKQVHEAKVSSKGQIHLAWAASFVAAILLSWGVLYSPEQSSQTPLSLASMMEKNFEQNKQLILTSYGQDKPKTLSAEIQKQFKELSSARVAINKALKEDPNNSDLLNLLRWTQQQELDLLQQVYSPQWQTI